MAWFFEWIEGDEGRLVGFDVSACLEKHPEPDVLAVYEGIPADCEVEAVTSPNHYRHVEQAQLGSRVFLSHGSQQVGHRLVDRHVEAFVGTELQWSIDLGSLGDAAT